VDERVFERVPPELASWAVAAGRPTEPRAWSPNCVGPGDAGPQEEEMGGPRIDYPLSGARFVIDPERPRELQRLDVKIVAPARTLEATLVVDGEAVARVVAPFDASWALRRGDHELVAEANGRRSAPVMVRVRE
jgi:hypothetical protein